MALDGTYGGLKATIADWINRRDRTAQIPTFVQRAHERISDQAVICAKLTANSDTVALPVDFRQETAVIAAADPLVILRRATAQQMNGGSGGFPRFYRIEGGNLILWPAPRQPVEVRLLYKVARAMFSADSDSNAVLVRHPFAYLYGAQSENARYSRDADAVSYFDSLVGGEIERISQTERADAMTGPLQTASSPYRGATP